MVENTRTTAGTTSDSSAELPRRPQRTRRFVQPMQINPRAEKLRLAEFRWEMLGGQSLPKKTVMFAQ